MEKVSFGEKTHKKVSLVVDTDLQQVEVINTNVRNIYEMEFDYSDKIYKSDINKTIIKDIEEYHKTHNITDAIIKFVAKVSEHDLYHVNQDLIRQNILDKQVSCLYNIQISVTRARQLRNATITEDVSIKKAMATFINELSEPDLFKEKMLKHANEIINEVEGK